MNPNRVSIRFEANDAPIRLEPAVTDEAQPSGSLGDEDAVAVGQEGDAPRVDETVRVRFYVKGDAGSGLWRVRAGRRVRRAALAGGRCGRQTHDS